jgi:hypothetical protein
MDLENMKKEYLELKEKREHDLQLMRNYFQNNTKNKIEHCDICNKSYKHNSFFNHKNSQKHQKLKILKNLL